MGKSVKEQAARENFTNKGNEIEMAEMYYKKFMRIVEYYVLICFVLISFVPLLEFFWVQGAVRFIYLTGFPLLVVLFIVSFVKEPIINALAKRLGS